VRESGQQFVQGAEQNAPKLITNLVSQHAELDPKIAHTERFHTKCSVCPYIHSLTERNLIRLLPVHQVTQTMLVNNLSAQVENWDNLATVTCPECDRQNTLQQKCTLDSKSDNYANIATKAVLKQRRKDQYFENKTTPSHKLNMIGVLYKVHDVVFHRGPSIIGGHYMAMVRLNKKWMQLDDEQGFFLLIEYKLISLIHYTTRQLNIKKIWGATMRFFMYFRRGIECRFPFFAYTNRFCKTSVFIIAHSPRTVVKRVGNNSIKFREPTMRYTTTRDKYTTLIMRKRYVYAKSGNRH